MQETESGVNTYYHHFKPDYNWLTLTTDNCTPENGWKFIEYEKHLDADLVKKVSESDYKSGMRYLKVRFLGDINPHEFKRKSAKEYKYAKVVESDIVNLDLSQSELSKGYRYIKVYVPNSRFRFGWVTYSEKEEGWITNKKKTPKRRYVSKRRNFRKRTDPSNTKMLDEIKQYISVAGEGATTE
jgi:hypothetical protein